MQACGSVPEDEKHDHGGPIVEQTLPIDDGAEGLRSTELVQRSHHSHGVCGGKDAAQGEGLAEGPPAGEGEGHEEDLGGA